MSLSGFSRGLNSAILQDIEDRNNGGAGIFGWFRLQGHGSSARVRFLHTDENDPNLIAVYEHTLDRSKPPYNVTCLGRENGCPLCEQGDKPSLKVYFLLWNYDATPDKDGNVRHIQVWKRGSRDVQNILGLIQEYGNLNSRDYKIVRQGTTMQNTSYQFFARDKSDFEFSDDVSNLDPIVEAVIRLVEPKTRDEIITLANGGSLESKNVEPVKPIDNVEKKAKFPF